MKTITFYSYKGGVGRSLALVNIATRLVEFGKKVCVIDFDLEAPGLHLKFPVSTYNLANNQGIVDYVYEFSNTGIVPESISSYKIDVPIHRNGKPLSLITAGNTESSAYWKKLSSINWYDLIFENPNGLAFFLNLKQKIEEEIKPDFLLIDSRTGISEMSGITLSLLADEVVVVAANNKENLGGAKKIIKSLMDGDSILDKKPAINFVLSRIPFTERPEDRAKESFLLNRIRRDYLSPYINDISVIHSDRELEEVEKVKIAYEKDESNTQISIDYLKLFEKLTQNDLKDNEVRRFKNIREAERLISLVHNHENYAQKIELINKAIELNKTNIDYYILKSSINFSEKKYSDSREDAEKALALKEGHPGATGLLINNLIELGQWDEALIRVEDMLSTYPNDINFLIRKCITLVKLKKFRDAEIASTQLIDLDPEFSIGYSCRGNVRRLQKNFEPALEDVYKALELDSENIQAIATLAEIYGELGRINEFYLQVETALKLDADYMLTCFKEEEIYEKFFNDNRFINLLLKYGVYLEQE